MFSNQTYYVIQKHLPVPLPYSINIYALYETVHIHTYKFSSIIVTIYYHIELFL